MKVATITTTIKIIIHEIMVIIMTTTIMIEIIKNSEAASNTHTIKLAVILTENDTHK